MGAAAWEAARIQDGRPVAGKELTEQHLPLDAGLYHAVSLNKGCYMGQETLAKVHKLNAVKQQLHGLMLDAPVPPGTLLLSGEHQALFRVMGRQGGGQSGVWRTPTCCVATLTPVCHRCGLCHNDVLLQSMTLGFQTKEWISAILGIQIDTH